MNNGQQTTTKEHQMSNTNTAKSLTKAMNNLKAAAEIFATLEKQAKAERKWAQAGTAAHYKIEIEGMISSDNGECGIEPYIKMIAAGR